MGRTVADRLIVAIVFRGAQPAVAGHSLCHAVAGGTSSRMAAPEKVVFYIRKTPFSAR